MANDIENGDSTEITLKELILKVLALAKYLYSKWIIIVFAGVVGGVAGFTYAYLQKPMYTAELNFALEDEKSSGGGLSAAMGLASQFGLDIGGNGGGAFSGDNLLTLLRSRAMVESALLTPVTIGGRVQTLSNFYIEFNELRDTWKNNPKLSSITFAPSSDRSKFSLQQDSILGTIYNDIIKTKLTVDKVDKKLSIINVRVKANNELFSKLFTETLVKRVSDFYVETKTKKSVQNVKILQLQTDSVRGQLNAAITGVASSADVNPNANPALQILRTPSQRKQVDVQANQAILSELVKNLEISKMALRKETPLIQIIDKPILPLVKEKPGKIKSFVIGSFVFSFLTILFLLLSKGYKKVMS